MVIDRFYFSSGKSAGSLSELLNELKVMDDECFFHHVNEEKNDFASWIIGCVGDKALGNRVAKMKDKDKIIAAIDKKIYTPAKVKKRIIHQIKEAILNA
jgi:hypothetical protein